MAFIWSNLVRQVRRTLGVDTYLVQPPGPGAEEGIFLRSSSFFSIAESSYQKSAAAEFVMYFLQDIDANRILSAERGVPAVSAVRQALAAESPRQMVIMFDYVDHVAANSSPPPPVVPDNVVELRDALETIVRQVAFDQIGPAEAAALLRSEWIVLMADPIQ